MISAARTSISTVMAVMGDSTPPRLVAHWVHCAVLEDMTTMAINRLEAAAWDSMLRLTTVE